MQLGSEVFFNSSWIDKIKDKRLAFLGHAASVNHQLENTFSLLAQHPNLRLQAGLSPQHGFHGIRQANMLTHEDDTFKDRPIFSLYSQKTRRLTSKMLDTFDVLVVDLQDVGCRIYTYLTSLFYILEDCPDKTVLILDRPSLLGRQVEGSLLDLNFKSFVGHARMPMAYGLTLGEAGLWFKNKHKLPVDLHVVAMKNYSPSQTPPFLPVLPSPNMTGLNCARCYPGTVLLEGTHISEGRGTTLPLETLGTPYLETGKIIKRIKELAPKTLQAVKLREHDFEPQFDKFSKKLCKGLQIHIQDKQAFQPYRLIACLLKAFYEIHPDKEWKTQPPYEYEYTQLPIDILSGSSFLRKWIEDPQAKFSQLDEHLRSEEQEWEKEISDFLIYH